MRHDKSRPHRPFDTDIRFGTALGQLQVTRSETVESDRFEGGQSYVASNAPARESAWAVQIDHADGPEHDAILSITTVVDLATASS